METELEKNERLYKDEVNILDELLREKDELERLIKHQRENVKKRELILSYSKGINKPIINQ
jgi:F0F1-type ATP synthase delta subunit